MTDNHLSQPTEPALEAYRQWRASKGLGEAPRDAVHDTLMWCEGWSWNQRGVGPDGQSPSSWARG